MVSSPLKWSVVVFFYIRLIMGLIIAFYPWTYEFPVDAIFNGLGILIMLTSGISISFKHMLKDIIK